MKRLIKPKKSCCRSSPRCRRCPVVAKRLIKRGVATARGDGLVVIAPTVTKKQLAKARKR